MSDAIASAQLRWDPVPGAERVFTAELVTVLSELHARFTTRIAGVRAAHAEALASAHAGEPFSATEDAVAGEPWNVPPLPAPLLSRGIEISGPAEQPKMVINALNPGPGGQRAVGYLDDDEDAGGHSLDATVAATLNRVAALEGTISHHDEERGRSYELAPGPLPFMVHRERGWHLDEPGVTIDGRPVAATLLGLAATLLHAGRAHASLGQGIYLYLPKCESVEEVYLYRDVLDTIVALAPDLGSVEIRVIVLIESLPATHLMESMLYALGPYAAGLNAARWDLKASLLEFAMCDPGCVWPDRFGVDIKSTPFLRDIFLRLVGVCARHEAVAIGGMATALPSADAQVNAAAAAAITADKRWESSSGFLRGWVAHTFHVETAAAPFLDPSLWPSAPPDPEALPVRIETPSGPITDAGTRRNVRTLIEYLEGWLTGRGAKAINSLPRSEASAAPALMEDLATARISVAQTAQRIRHGVIAEDTQARHSPASVKKLVEEELSDLSAAALDAPARLRYERSAVLAEHWIADYLALDFRSLGSWSRGELIERADRTPEL